MRLKKINAVLGLLSVLFLTVLIGDTVFCYLTLFYDPVLKLVFSLPCMVTVGLHAVCGILSVFVRRDAGPKDPYPRLNRRTLMQRISSGLMIPMLVLHTNSFSLLKAGAEKGYTALIILLIVCEMLFYATVMTHVSVSFSKALVTLGRVTSRETLDRIHRWARIVCALVFCTAVHSVAKIQISMFLLG